MVVYINDFSTVYLPTSPLGQVLCTLAAPLRDHDMNEVGMQLVGVLESL